MFVESQGFDRVFHLESVELDLEDTPFGLESGAHDARTSVTADLVAGGFDIVHTRWQWLQAIDELSVYTSPLRPEIVN